MVMLSSALAPASHLQVLADVFERHISSRNRYERNKRRWWVSVARDECLV